MAGKIIADTLETGAGADIATSYVVNGSAKAWATVNGSSGTPSLTFSLNCSSNTDLGTGSYSTNLTSAMSSANYPATTNDNERGCGESNPNTSSRVDVTIRNPTNLATVDATAFFVLHGDLA